MATPATSSYHSNSLAGVPQVGADVNVYDIHATAKFALGTKFERQDGAVFRYVNFGAINVAGLLCAKDANETGILFSSVITAPATAEQQAADPVGVYPNAKGSRYISAVFAAGTSANQYSGGYLAIAAGTGKGYTYRIKGHTATGTPATGKYLVELYGVLQATLAASTKVTISGNKYNDLMPAVAGTQAGIVAGVSMADCTTANYFGWVQTKGVAGIVSSGTLVSGQWCQVGSTTGTVTVYANVATDANLLSAPIAGYVISTGSATALGLISVNFE